MAQPFRIGMLMLHHGTPRDQQARAQLAEALPPRSEVTEPDEVGAFEVEVEAADQEDALTQIWDAVAASGTDDHIVFLEHPTLPEHWRRRAGIEEFANRKPICAVAPDDPVGGFAG